MNVEDFKAQMKKELERYKTSKELIKPYFNSMKEISDWLEKKDR